MKRLFLAVVLMAAASAADAQSPPYVYGTTIGTSPVQVLAINTARKKLFLYNPNATALIAFCPAGATRSTSGTPITCAINGAGSFTLQPYTGVVIEGGLANGTRLDMSTAWNAVASAGGSAYTILESE